MGFEKHLFISYAHIDNQPLTPEQQGWISRFHASLKAMLSMRLGGPAEIWRDEKLRGNDIFARGNRRAIPAHRFARVGRDAPLSPFGMVHQRSPGILSKRAAHRGTGGRE